MGEDIKEAKAKHTHNVHCQGKEEEEEITVVPATNTVVHPGAVMIKFLGAKRENERHPWTTALDHFSVKKTDKWQNLTFVFIYDYANHLVAKLKQETGSSSLSCSTSLTGRLPKG